MNDLTLRGANGLAIPPYLPMPNLPPSIERFMAECGAYADARARFAAAAPEEREAMHVGRLPEPAALTVVERAQAAKSVEYLGRLLHPVSLQTLTVWLGPVNLAVRNPQSPPDFAVRVAALHALLDDLPQGAFTAEARRSLPDFFPSAKDIRTAVEPGARRLRDTEHALAVAVARRPAARPMPTTPEPKTAEAIAAVRTTVQAFMAERNVATESAKPAVPPRASYLNERQRLEQFEAIVKDGGLGAGAAALRAEALRRKLAEAVA